MAWVTQFEGKQPRLDRAVFLAETAVLVGDVELGPEVSVWYGAVLRGDVGSIRVGRRTNLQDLVCVHVTGARDGGPEQADVLVGAEVTVGHGAVLHGCRVDDGCLIGMGAVVLDHAWIGERSVVAAGTVVPPKMVVPPRSFVRGVPARVVGELTAEQVGLGAAGAASYLELIGRYRASARAIAASDGGPGGGGDRHGESGDAHRGQR
jgi:carbonic anhydrase/acetyltransferase-like protein (isoleucine patch superfamily)